MSKKVNVFFEIETINRELDSRLFLASVLANSKLRFYIGQTNAIFDLVSQSKNGIYWPRGKRHLDKNFDSTNENKSGKNPTRYAELKKRGHKFIWLDEEGGVFWGQRPEWEQMMLRMLNPLQLDAEDPVCTWGDLQRDFYLSLNPACSERIETVGHPRFDLYKPKYREYFAPEVDRLREQYGDFLLVNTNFHRANTVTGLKKIFGNRIRSFTSDDRRYLLDRWLHINRVLNDFVSMITILSLEMPQLNVVIRPHPSENVDIYRTIFNGMKNVHVVQDGSVGPWLLAARAMMHDGCTTAIEGDMCGTQVINYKTVTDERFDIPLPNLFGVRCQSPEQAVDMMTRVLRGERLSEDSETASEKQAQIDDNVPNLIANFPVTREALSPFAQKIEEIAATLAPQQEVISNGKVDGKSRPGFGFLSGALHIKQKTKGGRSVERDVQPKFYGLQEAKIPAHMKVIQQMLNKEIHYSIYSNEIMCIDSD